MDYSDQIHVVYQLVNSDKYTEALVQIENLRIKGCDDVDLYLYEALCIYEANNDLEALRLLSLFLSSAGKHQKREYALFTTGICLMNLGLSHEASDIFGLVSSEYPGINTEREHARNSSKSQKLSLMYYSNIIGQKKS